MSLDPDTFSHASILSGSVPSQRWDTLNNKLEDKPIFLQAGAKDPTFNNDELPNTVKYFKNSGAKVTTHFIRDFSHVLPNAQPV